MPPVIIFPKERVLYFQFLLGIVRFTILCKQPNFMWAKAVSCISKDYLVTKTGQNSEQWDIRFLTSPLFLSLHYTQSGPQRFFLLVLFSSLWITVCTNFCFTHLYISILHSPSSSPPQNISPFEMNHFSSKSLVFSNKKFPRWMSMILVAQMLLLY